MELIYVICQLAAPNLCESHAIQFYNASPMVCMVQAQAELARNVSEGWQVEHWACTADRREALAVPASH